MSDFIGRKKELKQLKILFQKKTANLITIKGRRRIGKSRLIEEFSKGERFYAFAGLPLTPETTKQTQLDEFAIQLGQMINMPGIKADNWNTLFLLLANHTQKGKVIILFDEISWMGNKDPDFLGKLKNAWDLHFKKNPQLIFILCGSLSSWIEKNIISSTGFMGRTSLNMTLEELSLQNCNEFWRSASGHVSAFEKFKILSITGGVPRYLELINPNFSAEENIKNLCFSSNGYLINEFENIFSDTFSKRSHIYKSIIEKLITGSRNTTELTQEMGVARSGYFDEYLNDLVLGGFIAKDYSWHIKTGNISKLTYYRLKDNYSRFYLKYILPNKERIKKGGFEERTITSLPGWDSIMGLQFENLVINNHKKIIDLLNIRPEDVVFDNPFVQRKTMRQSGCQIDYLIQTKFNTVYVCEIKFSRSEIKTNIINEMESKLQKLKLPKYFSYRPILIHVNGVQEEVVDSGFFANIIDFGQLLDSM